MRQNFIALLLVLSLSIVHAQTKWVKIDHPLQDFVKEVSLHPYSYQYRMPSYPSIDANTGKFQIIDFYVNQDCNRYKLKATYCDLACVDTSDVRNYIPVQNRPPIKYDTSISGFITVKNPEIDLSNGLVIDTSYRHYLCKTFDGKLYALRYFWHQPDVNKSLLKRVSGNWELFREEQLKEQGAGSMLVGSWSGWGKPPKIVPYSTENLQYNVSCDTFEVYGAIGKQSIAFRHQMLMVPGELLAFYDYNLNAFALSSKEEMFNIKKNNWHVYVQNNGIYISRFIPISFYFSNQPLEMPVILCDDKSVDIGWYALNKNKYGLEMCLQPGLQQNRTITVKLKSTKGIVSEYKILLDFLTE